MELHWEFKSPPWDKAKTVQPRAGKDDGLPNLNLLPVISEREQGIIPSQDWSLVSIPYHINSRRGRGVQRAV